LERFEIDSDSFIFFDGPAGPRSVFLELERNRDLVIERRMPMSIRSYPGMRPPFGNEQTSHIARTRNIWLNQLDLGLRSGWNMAEKPGGSKKKVPVRGSLDTPTLGAPSQKGPCEGRIRLLCTSSHECWVHTPPCMLRPVDPGSPPRPHMLASRTLKPSPTAAIYIKDTSTSGCTIALVAYKVLCVRFTCFVRQLD
jgi:hypothetical protein